MNRGTTTLWLARITLVLAIASTAIAFEGSSGGGFELSWSTIDCGGGTSAAGAPGETVEISGTIGQHDAAAQMSGGGFELVAGFWSGGSTINQCPADITGDDLVNVSDLLALVGAWGSCANPNNCPADINGDDTVNVTDLLAVVGGWGICP